MELPVICGIALTAVFAALALKKNSPETSALIAISAGVMIFLSILSEITPFINEIYRLVSSSGVEPSYAVILIKAVGICALCQFTSDCCRDNGQSSLASRVEFAAKLSILLISLPLFRTILSAASGLISRN